MREFFKDQKRRLGAVRIAVGFDKQIDFANELGITKGTWSDLENSNNPLSLEPARQMKARWHLPLDFLLDGDTETIELCPAKILRKLEELASVEV
jgi:transcriptional regulator with XRE-family HTH domain